MTEKPASKLRPIGAGRTFSTTIDPTAPEVGPEPAVQQPDAPRETPRPKTVEQAARRSASKSTQPRRPRYDELERKDVRLREDQIAEIAQLARQISRQARRTRPEGVEAERITENTLIRVAVDLLLSKSSQLTGTNEAELRAAVGLDT